MEYRETFPSISDYFSLFLTTKWNDKYHFTDEELSIAIKNSWYAISVYEDNSLIGFGRIIADGIHHALIVDLIVHPDYQAKGIGSKILQMLVAKCREHNIRNIQLFSATGKQCFYEKHGFKTRNLEAPGMEWKG